VDLKKSLRQTTVTISVIIPVYNDIERLRQVLDSIKNQLNEDIDLEVLVVDNGSTQNIRGLITAYDFAKYILESKNLNSPYSCRNRGIEQAEGEVIVLLDATCIPDKNWLVNGIASFQDDIEKVVGGNVIFELDSNSGIADILDAVSSVQMGEAILNNKWAFTANLWVTRSLFQKYGKFPEGIRSGGDVRWTKKIARKNILLTYNDDCIVFKTTRSFSALRKKKWRTSKQQTRKWIDFNARFLILRHFRAIIKLLLLPPMPYRYNIKSRIPIELYKSKRFIEFRIWLLDYLLRIVEAVGIATGGVNELINIQLSR